MEDMELNPHAYGGITAPELFKVSAGRFEPSPSHSDPSILPLGLAKTAWYDAFDNPVMKLPASPGFFEIHRDIFPNIAR